MRTFNSTLTMLKAITILFFLCIASLAKAQVVTTVAGNGIAGFVNGKLLNAEFNGCVGVIINDKGVLFVADRFNNSYRKINPTKVSTLAGNGIAGYINGTGNNAEFSSPGIGMAIDKNGNLFVADQLNSVIRKITPSGVVTTFAGDGSFGFKDGKGTNAKFNAPRGLVFDTLGNLFVADEFNNCIRKINSSGVVTTVAGSTQSGHVDAIGKNARFNDVSGIAVDKAGNLYVAETGNSDIRKITPAFKVTTFAGNGTAGYKNGSPTNAEFNDPRGIAIDKQGNLYVAEALNNVVRKLAVHGKVTTFAGNATAGYKNGNALNAEFNYPVGITIDSLGNLYVADANNERIRKITEETLSEAVQEIDEDGIDNYSSIKTVDFSKTHSMFSVSPNPSRDFISIVSSNNVINVQVTVTDMNGKTLFTTKQNFVTGQNLKVSLSQFPSEVLIVTIVSNNKHEQFKIIKE